VSGGHTGLYLARRADDYACLGATRDDAVGEAFDKAARLLGLGYPGGPAIDRLRARAIPRRSVSRAPRSSAAASTSASAASRLRCASICATTRGGRGAARRGREPAGSAVDMLVDTTADALAATGVERLVVAGGVAANRRLRARMSEAAAALGVEAVFPRARALHDNAAMIALAGAPRLAAGASDGLDLNAEADLAFGSRPSA